jgi:hypothetical protein
MAVGSRLRIECCTAFFVCFSVQIVVTDVCLSSTYLEMNHKKNHPCSRTKLDSRCNMVVSGFGPYHCLVHADTTTERAAGVIPTPWAMPLMLGFGAILLGGE